MLEKDTGFIQKKKQEKIERLEAENAYLRQEIRGLKKKINKIAPLFDLDLSAPDNNISVKVCDDKGNYSDFLKMNLSSDSTFDEEAIQVFNEILDVFKQHGYK